MRWEDERYVRVYTRDTVDWQTLSFDAQALFLLLLRKVDRAGLLDLGRPGKRGVAVAVGHPREWPRLEPALEELLTDGCVRLVEGGARLFVPNFIAAQEAKSSDKSRQQKSRETARDLAAAEDVISRDGVSHGVTDGHDSGLNVTTGHAESQPVTPSRAVLSRAVPSRAESFPASQGALVAPAPDDLPDATGHAQEADTPAQRPALVLEAQTTGRKPRTPSAAETLYANLEADRENRCHEAGQPYVSEEWSAARQNKVLGPLVKGSDADQERFAAAWDLYLHDDRKGLAKVPWSISLFMTGGVRAEYETRAMREGAGRVA